VPAGETIRLTSLDVTAAAVVAASTITAAVGGVPGSVDPPPHAPRVRAAIAASTVLGCTITSLSRFTE
jgi:hypothetical protein